MASINKFHKIIITALLICFVCVFIGSIDMIRGQTIGASNNTNRAFLLGFSICLLIILFIGKCFRWLNTLEEKGCFAFSLAVFLLMTGIMIAVSFSARVMQFSDAYDVMDTAFFLRENAQATEELPYIKYVGSFGNNYPVILFQSYLIKILQWMQIQNTDVFLTHLNVVVILSAVFLTWLVVKEEWGMRVAAKTAVVCLLNPYFYLVVNWTYSMTFSLPIMMGILYVALRLKRNNYRSKGILLALGEGLLLGTGFLIRPTTVFPLIAAGVMWFPLVVRHRINRKRVIQILCILCAMAMVLAFANIKVEKRFGNIEHLKMPLSFWLLMGSHGNGMWSEADLDAMMAIQDPAEKNEYAFSQTLNNYGTLGIDGILNHWYKKLISAWADGGFFYKAPSTSEGNTLSEYILGSGARNQLTKMYSQAFRLMMIIGFLLACVFAVMRRKAPEIVLILMITIFGCVVFHSIWETNPRYSIPFILPMLTVIVYGIDCMQVYSDKRELLNKSQKRILGIVLMSFLIIVCSNLNAALKEGTNLNFYRILSTANTRVSDEIKPEDFIQLDQDFYSEKPFNTLQFKATLPAQKTKEECSDYILSILNDEEQILYLTSITPETVDAQGITVSFNAISGYNHYHVRLQKTNPEKESIRFYTHYTYAADEYRGVMTIDDGAPYPNDLMMDVYEAQKSTVFSDKARMLLIVLIMLLGGIISFVPITEKKGYYNVSLTKTISNQRAEEY